MAASCIAYLIENTAKKSSTARVGLNSSSESMHTCVVVALSRPVFKLQQCEVVLFRSCGDTHMLEKRQRPQTQNHLHIKES